MSSIGLIRGNGLATAVIIRFGQEFVPVKFLDLKVKPTDALAAVRYKLTSAPATMFDTIPPANASEKDTGPSAPLFLNCPSETFAAGLRIEGRSPYATPSVVGVFGVPVPSTHLFEVIHWISNAPTPRLKTGLFGAPFSFTTKVAPATTQPLLPNSPFNDDDASDIGNRIKLSSSPLCCPNPFTAADPETDKAPAAP